MSTSKQTVGRLEWITLNELKLPSIKAKIDTGAKVSALHAYDIEVFKRKGEEYIKFTTQPFPKGDDKEKKEFTCKAKLAGRRRVKSSNGQTQNRYVIEIEGTIGDTKQSITLTLTDRKAMAYRMLLGCTTLKGRYVVDVAETYLQGKLTK